MGGTTLCDDVEGLGDLTVGLKQGTPPRTTAKTSTLRKLALKRSELWCRTDPTQSTAMMAIAGTETTFEQTLYGKEALLMMLKKTSQAVKSKQIGDLDGPSFMKPFKTWRWLVPESAHMQARTIMGQLLAMKRPGGKQGHKTEDDIEDAALALSGDKAFSLSLLDPPGGAAMFSTSSSSSSAKSSKAGEKAAGNIDFTKFFGGKKARIS